MWSENSETWHGVIISSYKHEIKVSQHFGTFCVKVLMKVALRGGGGVE
jgi:hypothetical protein